MQFNSIITSSEDNSVDFKNLIVKYLKHWKWFLVSLILFGLLAKIYLRYSVLQYKATATILVKDDKSGGLSPELSAFEDLGLFKGSSKTIEDEIEILKSRTLIEKVVIEKEFNIVYKVEARVKTVDAYNYNPIKINFLKKDAEFYNAETTLKVEIVSPKKYKLFDIEDNLIGEYNFGNAIITELGPAIIYYTNPEKIDLDYNVYISISSLKNTANYFKSRLAVMPLNKFTNVIELSAVDPVKEKAEDFINKLIELYNKDAIADKNLISEKTSKFIADRLGIITSELGDVEKEAENYKKKNNITDLPTEAELYLDNASDFKKNSIEVGTRLKVVDLMIDYLNKNKNNDVIPANIVPDEGNSAALIVEYNNLVIERDRLLKSSTNDNPVVQRLNEKISTIKSSVSQSLTRLKSSLLVKNSDLEKQNNLIGGKIAQIPRQEREYRGIFRQQQIKEELYLYLFKKREETAISLAVTAPNAKIVDPAFADDVPVAPNRMLIYLISGLLGLLIPFSIIYLFNMLDTKVKSKEDIESLGIPFVGDVPHSESNNEIIQPDSRTSSAEAIRIVRTNLEFILNNVVTKGAKTIFLTSTLPAEGKTFIAVNLAATIALSGKKVLLVGLDIRNPKLDEYIKIPNRGVTNYLSSDSKPINDYIIKQEGYQHFDVLPAGIIPPNPAELLMNYKLEQMFDTLKESYDYIIVDTAPVSLVTDTLLISKNADSFIYVVRANYLEKQMLKLPESLYKEKKLPNMSILLNDTDVSKGYGYGYGYVESKKGKKPWYKNLFSNLPFMS